MTGRKVRATYVTNGQEAREALKAGSFDLGLIDIRMPEMEGIAFKKACDKAALVGGAEQVFPLMSSGANTLPEKWAKYRRPGYRVNLAKSSTSDQIAMAFARTFDGALSGMGQHL